MRSEQPLRTLLCALALGGLTSCATAAMGDDADAPIDAQPTLDRGAPDATPAPGDAPPEASFDGAAPMDVPAADGAVYRCPSGRNVEADIFAVHCGVSGCHEDRAAAAGLDLRSPGVRARVADAPSNVCSGRRIVVPGVPAQSVLVEKLLASNTCGDRMPLGAPPLSDADIDCVRAWVAATPAPPRPDASVDVAAERSPCEASDGDGDGHGTHPSCPAASRDCDDRNGAVHPGATEACNGVDDDCDGRADEELGEGSCGLGACRRTVPYCVMGRPARCEPGAPSREACNGLDDDCDGAIDDEAPGASCGMGLCARTARCVGGRVEPCVPGPAAPEACNGMDDDCDGAVDEGFRAAVPATGYSTLVTIHDACNGSSERMGPNCNAAIHRYCGRRGCTTTGFGPVENAGDTAVVACVVAEATRTVSFDDLSRQHPSCSASTQRTGVNCNSAIHRWCRGQGFASGFGPVEQGPTDAHVTCLRAAAASVVETTFTALAAAHPGCSGGTRVWGPDCNAAIHRFCARRGAASGYGPVEYGGDAVTVVCVSN